MNTLEKYLFEKYKDELEEILPGLQQKRDALAISNSPKLSGIRKEILNGQITGSIAGLTPLSDALYLYLLVREYKPQNIFEIGTWVGTSALFMAEAFKKNGGGHIYTCDTNQYYILSDEYADLVTYIPGHSDTALEELKVKGVRFDFVFIDGNVSKNTTKLLAATTHSNTVFAMHDFVLPDDKGVQAFLRLPQKGDYAFVSPQPHTEQSQNIIINKMIALFLPTNKLGSGLRRKSAIILLSYRLTLLLGYIVGRAWRKMQSTFK